MDDDERVNSRGKSWMKSTVITFMGVQVVGMEWMFMFGIFRIRETTWYSMTRVFLFTIVHFIFFIIYGFLGQLIIVEEYLAVAWFQQHHLNTSTTDDQGKDDTTKSDRPIIVGILIVVERILVATVSMVIMVWSLYYGFKVAAEAYADAMYHGLASSIGILSVAFGFIYLIICMGGLVEHVLDTKTHYVKTVTVLCEP